MRVFVFGSSIVSSYWNGAATYYRGIYKYLARRGHQITFAEPDAYQRQDHRDPGDYSWIRSIVYQPHVDIERMMDVAAVHDVIIKHSGAGADDALLESLVPSLKDGSRAVIFWDVDAPATLGRLHADPADPFHADIPRYDAIFTYGGGPDVRRDYLALGAQDYYSIYNGLDPETHFPVPADASFACDVAFLGNRLPDREQRVCELFLRAADLAPAKKFLLGGEGWGDKPMPPNVRWIGHVPTGDHNRVNCSAGMVMNINRSSMANVGFSPPTRIFEAAGCGACLLCDEWPGIEECFTPGNEILIIRSAEDVVDALERYDSGERMRMGRAFHARALREHSYARRAERAEQAFLACLHRQDQTTTVAPVATIPVGEPA